jgi:hypothetical protein
MSTVGSTAGASYPGHRNEGLTLRQAALIAGFSMLIMTVAAPFAEFFALHKLVIPSNIEQTVQNIAAHRGLFLTAIFCYLINFILDVLIAWALYILLIPVNRSVSLLTAWFRLVYTALGLFGLLNLVTVFRILDAPDYLTAFGAGPLHAQVKLLLNSFRYDWSIGLMLFAIHLVLLGYLIYRSTYIPKIIGVLLCANGLAWLIDTLQPYLYPDINLRFLFIAYLAELVFMFWLLVRGWKIQDPALNASRV